MRQRIAEVIREKIAGADWIREPIVGFADVNSAKIRNLKTSVAENHLSPEEILPEARIIISYFLPFTKAAGLSNQDGDFPSQEWADYYNATNALIAEINEAIKESLEADGIAAAIPPGGFDTELLMSRWSHRHIAEAAGLGTFGKNNMLITRVGSMGRFGSVVTALDVDADFPMDEELCLGKNGGRCSVCVKRCPTGALSDAGFDRVLCYALCLQAEERLGADVCGKCAVGIPCGVWEK